MKQLNHFCSIDSHTIQKAAEKFGTPFYLYDEKTIVDKCHNSHEQVSEILFTTDRQLTEIRSKQTLEQLVANEIYSNSRN